MSATLLLWFINSKPMMFTFRGGCISNNFSGIRRVQLLIKRLLVKTQRIDAQQSAASAGEKKPSCWSRINCFKCCKPCCGRLRESCCCFSCCRKKPSTSTDSLQSDGPKEKDNSTPGTCTRIFCFCCLCCRKKPEDAAMEEKKRMSLTSQQSKEGWVSEHHQNFYNKFLITVVTTTQKLLFSHV